MTGFWTLLGPDFAGKSSALARLRDEHGWQVVSHDDRFVVDYPLIATIRGCWIEEVLAGTGGRYTAELAVAALHPVILHQRDELARQRGTAPLVIDSFYYKVLAACELLGVAHEPTFDYWRSFPQPDGIIYLDVPAEVGWQRSGQGATASAFEHYGRTATRDGFIRLQNELRDRMLAEISGLPVTIVDGTASPDAVLATIVSAVRVRTC